LLETSASGLTVDVFFTSDFDSAEETLSCRLTTSLAATVLPACENWKKKIKSQHVFTQCLLSKLMQYL